MKKINRQNVAYGKVITIFLLLSVLVFACTEADSDNHQSATPSQTTLTYPNIDLLPVSFPVRLEDVNLANRQSRIQLPTEETIMIGEVIRDFYINECHGDAAQKQFKMKDTYLGTLWATDRDSLTSVFYVLLQNPPAGTLTGKVIFYDNLRRRPLETIIDNDISQMYHLADGRFVPEESTLALPVLELFDFNKDGVNDFKINRYYRQEHSTLTETRIYDVSSGEVKGI